MCYNWSMLTGLSKEDHENLLGILRMNQYVANWPILLDALRHLWEIGKASELKTPFYDLVDEAKKFSGI